ncbi:unnamed protein product [Symbiodinium necroappetens]|uniref:Uncharacterized protein n=1 Tax=Symbiodinium necroappetens TaxID=1628268 RepID=A0A813CMC3_9DINO|nr:unnamed protein product [Symbiodinium necroappetens]
MLRRPFCCICEFIVALAWRDAAPDFLSLDRPSPSLTPDSLIAKAEASSGAANQSANESHVTPEALLSVLREEHKKNRRLRKRLYRMMHRESENFSETVTAARSMQRDLSSYLHNLTHQAWRKRAKTHRSTSNLERRSFDRSAEQTPEEDSLMFPDYETELETNMELRNRLAQLESYFNVQADQWQHALSVTSEHATKQSQSRETTVPGPEKSPSQDAGGAETTPQQSVAGTTTTTVSSGEAQPSQSGSQDAGGAETTPQQSLAGTTTTTVSSGSHGAASTDTEHQQPGKNPGGAKWSDATSTNTTKTKQQQPSEKPEQSVPAETQESRAVTTTEHLLSTEPELIVDIGPGGSGSTATTSGAPAAANTTTRTSQRTVSTHSRPQRKTSTAKPTTSTEEPARARAVGKTAQGPEAAEAAATEAAEAASWFRGGRREPEPNATRASSEHADADQKSRWNKERLDVAEGNEIKFGFSRSDQ